MLLQTLRAFSLDPGGPEIIWNYSKVLVRSTRVSGRVAWNIRNNFDFVDACNALWGSESLLGSCRAIYMQVVPQLMCACIGCNALC